jgi:acetyl-CoA synthetase
MYEAVRVRPERQAMECTISACRRALRFTSQVSASVGEFRKNAHSRWRFSWHRRRIVDPLETLRDVTAPFSWKQVWQLFDGSETCLNIAHECLDRHPQDEVAGRVVSADGTYDEFSFGEASIAAGQIAQLLADSGVNAGDRVGVMMEPSLASYAALFGIIKRGAVAVPLYTLFGPDAIRDRLDDCDATLLIVGADAQATIGTLPYRTLVFDDSFWRRLSEYPGTYESTTSAGDLAVLQYTSGTSRQMPAAIPHTHRSMVTLMRAAIFAVGIERTDRYFCPSSPAWGHGLWHGTIAPLSLGVALGGYAGRFEVHRFIDALDHLKINNLAAAGTIYRMMIRSGRDLELKHLTKASYTGEELDATSQEMFRTVTGIPVCGMYGTTESGVVIGNYPGYPEFAHQEGALGKPLPGCEVTIRDPFGQEAPAGTTGEISLRRRDSWIGLRDLGHMDSDGYFWYHGRSDDVIIAAGWTISPTEVERTLMAHKSVHEAAIIGLPDDVKGQVLRAYIIADRHDDDFAKELQSYVRKNLSPHEYPKYISFVTELPKLPNGKVNRRALASYANQAVGAAADQSST